MPPYTTLFDSNSPEYKDGVDLHEWLQKNERKLDKKRALYILKPVLETSTSDPPNLFKFGRAGMRSSPDVVANFRTRDRLKSYLYEYGYPRNSRKHGVRLYHLIVSPHSNHVRDEDSWIWKKEHYIKKELERRNLIQKDRGAERTTAPLSLLQALIKDGSNKSYAERQAKIKQNEALKDREITDKDTFVISGHQKPRSGSNQLTWYLIDWARPYKGSDSGLSRMTYNGVIKTLETAHQGKSSRNSALSTAKSQFDDYWDSNANVKHQRVD